MDVEKPRLELDDNLPTNLKVEASVALSLLHSVTHETSSRACRVFTPVCLRWQQKLKSVLRTVHLQSTCLREVRLRSSFGSSLQNGLVSEGLSSSLCSFGCLMGGRDTAKTRECKFEQIRGSSQMKRFLFHKSRFLLSTTILLHCNCQ